jgi:hypothetical protein
MKRTAGLLTVIFAFLFCFVSVSHAMDAYDSVNWIDASGTIVYAGKGRETTASVFAMYSEVVNKDTYKQPAHFLCKHNNIEIQIPIAEIRSIKVSEGYKAFGRNPYPNKLQSLTLTMKNGKVFDVAVDKNMSFGLSNFESIEFKYFSPISDKFEFGSVLGESLREIRFD